MALRRSRFWTAPRRSWLRLASFQIHLWAGVLIGIYVILISLSGSVLVFRDEIERAASPSFYRVSAGSQGVPLDKLLAHVRAGYPGFQIQGIDDLDQPRKSTTLYLSRPGPLAQSELMVYADPGTGDLLGSRFRFGGFLGWCANLHYYLLAGDTGYLINGILALAFLFVCLTGWLLWWPGIRRLRSGFHISWRARWKRLNWDLHTVGGFWSNPALFLVVLSGVYFVFPKPLLYLAAVASGDSPATIDAIFATPKSDAPAGRQPVSVQAALDRIRGALPAGVSLRYLALPSGATGVFDGIAYPAHGVSFAQPVYLYLDQYSGAVLRTFDARSLRWGLRFSTYVYTVHFGTFAGVVSKVLWVLLGLLSAALMVTGYLMYWNRYLSGKWKQLRKKAEPSSHELVPEADISVNA